MKNVFLGVILFVFIEQAPGQNRVVDSLRECVATANTDSSKVESLGALADYYGFVQFDSCLFYAEQTIDLSNRFNNQFGKYLGLRSIFHAYNSQGNYPKALEIALSILKAAEQSNNVDIKEGAHYFLGLLNREMGNFPSAINEQRQAIQEQQAAKEPIADVFYCFSQLAIIYGILKQKDSALWYAQRGYDLGLQSKRYPHYFPLAIAALGNVHTQLGHYELAKNYFLFGIEQSKKYNNIYFEARNYNLLAGLYHITGHQDSCVYYARLSLELCQQHNFSEFKEVAAHLLTQVYDLQNKHDSALKYIRIELVARDSVFSQSKVQQFQKVAFDEQLQRRESEVNKERYRNQVKLYSLLSALGVFLVIGFILYRNNKQKQRANKKIEKAYNDLKSTQTQLIQSEKMASLGELTAGIAHEIQNPLNFVNNFSEVNNELIEELKIKNARLTDAVGQEKSRIEDGEADELLSDIYHNNEKILMHGKRADAIVKGMLQHSRSSSGLKEPTDINKLADEYLRLAYHGLRAKDKAFNAVPIAIGIKTEFDDKVGKINIVPQEIGRVMLNLINNAFYAVSAKATDLGKTLPDKLATADNGYEPMVIVSTKRVDSKVLIGVKDNGNGIPKDIVDKVFQPFFTTKPTGQGTGLGLSLAYDIIKAHGGEIKVQTEEGEGSEFVVQLPIV